MKPWFEALAHRISAKKAVLLLSAIVFFHLGLMWYLFENSHAIQQAARRGALFQKVINAIYLVEAMPEENRAKAVSAMADPDVQVSFSETPQWPLQFQEASFWKIVHTLERHIDNFAISVQLDKNQWLNIKTAVYSAWLFRQLLWMIVELLVFGSILVAFWSINRFTQPLKKIRLSTERLGIDLETKPLPVYGPKVVQEVFQALNQMQERILQLIRNRTLMLAAISHDLRTPIARARLRTQFIEEGTHKTQLLSDLSEMEHMISETLAFAREDAQREEKKWVDLASILKTICDDASDMGHRVSYQADSQRLPFMGRPIALKRAFSNLIYNAIRYAGNADVSMTQRGNMAVITIVDNGPGIPEADLDKVFEPFYRGDKSRSRDTGGVGLGLSVTRDIIHAHHGKIKLKNRKPCGLEVVVFLNL